jgi:hypothetical protein
MEPLISPTIAYGARAGTCDVTYIRVAACPAVDATWPAASTEWRSFGRGRYDAVDITQLILDDHHEQRRLFAILEEIPRQETDKLSAVWKRLRALLDLHAEAEERHFYPTLVQLGKGGGGSSPDEETEDAIDDHNEIRDTAAKVEEQEVGSDAWYQAVAACNKANGDHMAEEEREGLTDFRQHIPLEIRHDLGVRFAAFEAEHVTGVEPVDKDPQTYIDEQKR